MGLMCARQGRRGVTMQVDHAGGRKRKAAPAAHAHAQFTLPAVPGKRSSTLAIEEPSGPVGSPEYDPFEAGEFAQGIALGTAAEFLGPVVAQRLNQWLPADRYPWLASKYGKVAVGKSIGFGAVTLGDLVSQPAAWGVRTLLHGAFPKVAGDPGSPFPKLAPANVLAGRWAKRVLTGMGQVWLADTLKPDPPKPMAPPALPADTPKDARVVSGWLIVDPAKGVTRDWAPGTAAPQVLPPPPPVTEGPKFNGQDVRKVAADSVRDTAVRMVVGGAYDQVVGPVVQKAINVVMGRGDEPIRKPAPITPGAFANAVGSAFLGTLLMKPVAWKGPGSGLGPALATSLVNGLIASTIDSVYSRGIGGAIEDAINGAIGLPTSGRKPETFGAERVLRTVARGAASTGAAFWLEGISQAFFQGLATQLGGPLGAFVGMAGPTMAGLMGGSVVDALVGAQIGRVAGSIYSWITGKPQAENRPVIQTVAGPPTEQTAGMAPQVGRETPARARAKRSALRMQAAVLAAH